MAPNLDHIIILVPHSTLSSPPPCLTDNFTVTPGGRHADNLTENKLIIFRDGSYIELIAFITPSKEKRAKHWWGRKKEGIIDFAFTTEEDASKHYKDLQGRLLNSESKATYDPPRSGGRTREFDGQEIKWHVTFPLVGPSPTNNSDFSNEPYQRGLLPFFCHDVTPRPLRVPLAEENVEHPCGAEGIKALTVYVPEERVSGLKTDYAAVLGVNDSSRDQEKGGIFKLDSLYGGRNGVKERVQISVKAPEKLDEALRKEIEERGGVVLGDLIVWGHSHKAGQGGLKRVDAGDGETSLGGLLLDLSLPNDQ